MSLNQKQCNNVNARRKKQHNHGARRPYFASQSATCSLNKRGLGSGSSLMEEKMSTLWAHWKNESRATKTNNSRVQSSLVITPGVRLQQYACAVKQCVFYLVCQILSIMLRMYILCQTCPSFLPVGMLISSNVT
jgi:hypothetical protein